MSLRGQALWLAFLALPTTNASSDPPPLSGQPAASETGSRFRGKYRNRRNRNLLEGELREAREGGLDWLARHQDESGQWSGDQFDQHCGDDPCGGKGAEEHSIGLTGLALLAFLAAGHSADEGAYQSVVSKGLEALVRQQDSADGCLSSKQRSKSFLYHHAIGTQALVEGYGLSNRPDLKRAAQRAVDLIQHARNPTSGWRYEYPPDGTSDTSVTGWMVSALRAAQDFDLDVDPGAFRGALDFVDSMTTSETWRTGYISLGAYSARTAGSADRWPADRTEAMTAAALLCRLNCGQSSSSSPALEGGARLITLKPPRFDPASGCIDFYYWYHATYALHWLGGPHWEDWEPLMRKIVLANQVREGHAQGSWDPAYGPWGATGGRVYATALLTLCLSVQQRYDHSLAARVDRLSGSPAGATGRTTRFSAPLERLLSEYERSRGSKAKLLSIQGKLDRYAQRKGDGDWVVALLYSGYASAEAGELDVERRPLGAAVRFTRATQALQKVMESGSALTLDGQPCVQLAARLRLELHKDCVSIFRRRMETEDSYGQIDFKNDTGYHQHGIELCEKYLGKSD